MKLKYSQQISTEIKGIMRGYPGFVFSSAPARLVNEIPVFVFHSFEPGLFEEQLTFLKENSYKTLTVNEYVNIINGNVKPEENSVLLTADDARISFWLFAYPLLKKFNMHATLFIIPGLTKSENEVRFNLEDYWNGKISHEDLNNLDPFDETLCNWKELKIMYDSGCVDIEIHTLFHKEIFTNNKIINFITTQTKFLPFNSAASPYLDFNNIGIGYEREKLLGLPLFESAPLMKGFNSVKIIKDILNESKKIYDMDPENFEKDETKRNAIKVKLQKEIESMQDEIEKGSKIIYTDLTECKKLISENINHSAGNHLCLPWTIGSKTAIDECKKLNIQSCFWGIIENKRINKVGDDPYYSCRIKNDFIFRLPGEKNRKSLFSIYNYKLRRRISNKPVF